MPEALEGGENSVCNPSCPFEAEDAELTPESLAFLDRDLGGQEDERARIRRRELDGRIVERLRAENFEGANYQKVVNRLSEYGYYTMTKWTASGEIFRKARQAGRPVPADKISFTWAGEDRHAVSVESVLGGLEVFRSYGLISGRWSPQGGANLDTYFIGAVIRAFPRVYIRWFDGHQRGQAELEHPAGEGTKDPFGVPDQRATDPVHVAVTHDYISRLLPLVTDPQVREALGWRALGYTQAQAAQRVDLTEKALERRISRLRDRLTKQVRQFELGEGGAR
ncbi:RNA polymerase sigma factor [Streptomyces virginiae]|uniref:RNA polymerase sigma factor n=1 Tax=Streptomyces virginiae TaxID=1961 RepID=UPI003251E069